MYVCMCGVDVGGGSVGFSLMGITIIRLCLFVIVCGVWPCPICSAQVVLQPIVICFIFHYIYLYWYVPNILIL